MKDLQKGFVCPKIIDRMNLRLHMRYQTLTLFIIAIFSLSACLEAPNNSGGRENNNPQRPGINTGEGESDLSPYLRSQTFRDRGTSQYTINNLRKFLIDNSANAYPDNIFGIPDRQAHDIDEQTINYVSSGNNTDCGLLADDNSPNIQKRIADCKEKFKSNPDARYWEGKRNGLSGEGNWVLVLKKGDRHIWLDESTNLVWTDNITEATWPIASGSEVASTNAICHNDFLTQDVADENTDYFAGLTPDEIKLRLPTRNDFLLADINGARFVLDDLASKTYWSANYISDTNQAWTINQKDGILSKTSISATGISVRCVGIIIK